MKTLQQLQFRETLRTLSSLGVDIGDTLNGTMLLKFLEFSNTPVGKKWQQTPEAEAFHQWQREQ